MKLGLIGIGKMGYNLALNMLDNGHELIVHDIIPENTKGLEEKGALIAAGLADMVSRLDSPRILFMMVPVGNPVEETLAQLDGLLEPGDIIIDGGNSHYGDAVTRSKLLQSKGVRYLDCGTSGGKDGARNGVCLMIGGDESAYRHCEPLFKSIAVADGCLYTGPSGSGHYCKMVHNGIEYGMMQAIAEGFEILQKSDYTYDMEKVAKMWNHGSVVRSWLMELAENAFREEGNELASLKGIMNSTGEGKWTVEEALAKQICTPVIALSLIMRYRSMEEDTFSGKVVAALRNQFGGHAVEYK
jgi:6-phosphogluconate dehydrogenase (decarboxylating)